MDTVAPIQALRLALRFREDQEVAVAHGLSAAQLNHLELAGYLQRVAGRLRWARGRRDWAREEVRRADEQAAFWGAKVAELTAFQPAR